MLNNTVLHIGDRIMGGGAESVFLSTVSELRKKENGMVHLLACTGDNIQSTSGIDLVFPAPSIQNHSQIINNIYSKLNYKLLSQFLSAKTPGIIHVQNFGLLSPSVLQAIFDYKEKEKKNGNKIKVIHTSHSFYWTCSHFAALDYRKKQPCLDCLLDRYRTRIFYRGCSRGGWTHSWGKGLAALLIDYYLNRGLFDYCLTPSDFVGDLVKKRFPAQRVQTVRNPLADTFSEEDFPIPLQEKKNKIVYFGRLSAGKNIPVLLEAFRFLQQGNGYEDLTLEIIGEGEENESLKQMVGEKEISNVTFMGFLPYHRLREQLRTAKVSVLPSLFYETAGLSIPESIFERVVPVATDHGALRESIHLFGCGLGFEYNNPVDLAAKIEEAFRSYNDYALLFDASQKKIKEIMDGSKYADLLLTIYKENF